jgi:N-acetyl sugar amidotransferase
MTAPERSSMEREYRICKRCVMDTSDPDIRFDEQGICNHCRAASLRLRRQMPPPDQRPGAFARLIDNVRAGGRRKPYDCLIGVSGGVDSSYVAWLVKDAGLRPLAVHFDNGWNSELAVDNIKTVLDRLNIELITHVVDWDEFRDLQLAFLKGGLVNCEAPTDHAINSLMLRTAARFRLRYILSGSNLATETIMPYAWSHYNQDLRLLKAVHHRWGTRPLKTLPTLNLAQYAYLILVRGIRQVPLLNYVDYDNAAAKAFLTSELGWRDYGGKHYESIWTRFFQGYYLVEKFGYDKRRSHLASMIVSGLLSREEGLERLALPPYDPQLLQQDLAFVLKKFGLSAADWDTIMKQPKREARDLPSHYFLFHKLRRCKDIFRRIATEV